VTKGETEIGLALAGGNALGAYGAGAYEALHERGWVYPQRNRYAASDFPARAMVTAQRLQSSRKEKCP